MKKSDHEKSYYEDNFNWQRFETNHWIEIIKSIIPPNVMSLLDVGCGNGIITKPLMLDYRVFGIDRIFNL